MKLDHVLAGTAITQAVSFAGRGSFPSRERSSCQTTLTLIAISTTDPLEQVTYSNQSHPCFVLFFLKQH